MFTGSQRERMQAALTEVGLIPEPPITEVDRNSTVRFPRPRRSRRSTPASVPATPTGDRVRVKPRAFVCYRREDCLIHSSALVDGLTMRLPDWSIFRDIESIPPGVDWRERIGREIAVCSVILVMIGDNWLDRNRDGKRRVDDPEDQLALEISSAMERGVTVIPVLVEGARMPQKSELPSRIADLTRFNAMSLTDPHWTADIDRLARRLRELREQTTPTTARSENTLQIPSRVTSPWLASTVPEMTKEQLGALVSALRRRRWSEGEIRDTVYPLAKEGAAPPPREPIGGSGSATPDLPDRITMSWLQDRAPDLEPDELVGLVAELRSRGWSEGEIEDHVYAVVDEDAVSATTI
jgi:TIR domain